MGGITGFGCMCWSVMFGADGDLQLGYGLHLGLC